MMNAKDLVPWIEATRDAALLEKEHSPRVGDYFDGIVEKMNLLLDLIREKEREVA